MISSKSPKTPAEVAPVGVEPFSTMSKAQRVLLLARSACIGWVAMLVFWAVYMFLLPHRIKSEIGPLGGFIVFGLAFSAIYLVDFLIITVPMYFISLLLNKERSVRSWFPILFGAGLYLLSVKAWCSAYDDRPEWHLYVLAATAGAASVYALSLRTPMAGRAKPL